MKVATIDDLRRWRRYLHQYPELSLEEVGTADYIRQELKKMNIEYECPLPTATLVYLEGNTKEGILLRADIDALPIEEETGLDYASSISGKMHACGHDGHTATLLACLKELKALQMQGKLVKSVVAVFQPAEETHGGGNLLVQAVDWIKYTIQGAYALHVNPDYPVGMLVSREGELMASCTEFTIEVQGVAAHVGVRERGKNALNAACLIYQQLLTLPTFDLDAKHTNIIHIGQMQAGTAVNIVPDVAVLRGTIRTYDIEDLGLIKSRMESICEGINKTTGCSATLYFAEGYPPVINDKSLMIGVENAAQSAGAQFYLQEDPYLLGEDFSFYKDIAPINFTFIGIRNEAKGYTAGLHTPRLSFDEEALIYGVDYFTALVQGGKV